MQRCNDLLIAGIKTYGGLTSYLGNPDGGRSLLSELQLPPPSKSKIGLNSQRLEVAAVILAIPEQPLQSMAEGWRG